MFLLRIINYVPLWLLIFTVVGALEVYSVGLMLACRRKWGPDRLKLNNEVAGFKFSVIGVLYAVLLAFVVIAVWEDYRNTETAVRNEVKAIVDLNQLSYALPEPSASTVRSSLAYYVEDVRKSEWATMARGLPSITAAHGLAHLTEAIINIPAESRKDLALYQQALHLLSVIEDNRSERLDSADGSVPPILWLVLIAGAMVTLGYPAFFGTSNLFAQTLMTATLAALVALALLPALLLDYPFTGQGRIPATAFEQAMQPLPPHPKGHPPPGFERAPQP
jgi:hypothetical protein